MTALVFLLGFSIVGAVAAFGASLLGAWRSQALVELAEERGRVRLEELQTTVAGLQKTLDGQTAHFKDVEHQPLVQTVPAVLRPGLNLGKRSQVLRMHRNGEAAERIAAALEIPRQEVDLLIKVHRIVIASL
jgi:hypothetical protein